MPRPRQPEIVTPQTLLQAARNPASSIKSRYKGKPEQLARTMGLSLPEKPVLKMLRLGVITPEEAIQRFGAVTPGLRELVLDVCTLEERSAVAVGPRGGGKSMGVSFIEFYLWMVEDFDALNLGGSELQAANVYSYIQNYVDSHPEWMKLIRGDMKISESTNKERAWIKVLTASEKSTRSPHAGGLRTVNGRQVARGGLLVIDEEAECDPKIVNSVLPTINTALPSVNVRCCFTPDTLISMEDGSVKRIDELEINDRLLRLDARSTNPQIVQAIHRRWFDGELLSLGPAGQPEVTVTKEHMLFSGSGELPAEQAAKSWLVSPSRVLHSTQKDCFDLGWIVGFFLAEGSFRKLKTVKKDGTPVKSHEIMFSVHKDEADEVANILWDWDCGRYPNKSGVKGARYPRIVSDKRGDGVAVYYSSKGLRNRLERLIVDPAGYAQKHLRQLPTQKEFAEGVLRGWLAGDATNYTIAESRDRGRPIKSNTLSNRSHISVDGTTAYETLAWQMRQIALDVGCKASINSYFQSEFSKGAENKFWRVSVNQDADSRWWKWQRGNKDRRSGLTCRTTINTKYYAGDVYDLTVSDGHVYVANGILAHNSTFHNEAGTFAEVVDGAEEMGYKLYRWDVFDVCSGCECVGGCQSEEKCFREDHYEEYVDPDTGQSERKLLHRAYCGGRARYAEGHVPLSEIETLWRRIKRNHELFEVEQMGSRPSSTGFVIKNRQKFAENQTDDEPSSLYLAGFPASICVDWGTVAAAVEVWQAQPGDKHVLLEADLVEEADINQILGVITGYASKYVASFTEVAADVGGGGNYLNPLLRTKGLPTRDVPFADQKEAAVVAFNLYNESQKIVIPKKFTDFITQVKGWRRKNGRIVKGNDHLCDAAVCYFSKFIEELGVNRFRVPPQTFSTRTPAVSPMVVPDTKLFSQSRRNGSKTRALVAPIAMPIRSPR